MARNSLARLTLAWYLILLGMVLIPGWPAPVTLSNARVLGPAALPPEPLERATMLLMAASVFTSARVGYGARLTAEGEAWNALLASSDPATHFRTLLDRARTPAAELYALAGLSYTDRAAFNRAVWLYGSRGDYVLTQRGCVSQTFRLREVVAQIADGQWQEDLRVPASDWPYELASPPEHN